MSVRFILGDEEQYSDDFSGSESKVPEADSDDDWKSCVSPVEEDECFYYVVSLDISQDASYSSFPTRSLNSVPETNLSGLAKGCRQPSKSDQVPDLNEKAYLMQKSQVPELNETYLVEGKRQLQNAGGYQYGTYLKVLSNMMEEETHVVENMSEHEGIGQVLFDEIEDQSEVSGRAERAISGLPQSNQWRLGKSEGEPGTRLSAINSDRQSQKVGLGNLSLNSPNEIVGDIIMSLARLLVATAGTNIRNTALRIVHTDLLYIFTKVH